MSNPNDFYGSDDPVREVFDPKEVDKIRAIAPKPRPETASAGVGPITFEQFMEKEFPFADNDSEWTISEIKQVWLACEASKQPPGRWVLCSERLPEYHGVYHVQWNNGLVGVGDTSTQFKVASDAICWWEWTYQIPSPPAIDQDEDEKAFNDMIATNPAMKHPQLDFLPVKTAWRLALAHARKGK